MREDIMRGIMDIRDATGLVHFRELHFFPRVIFSLGLVFLIGSFFVKNFLLGFFGVTVILSSATLNLFINSTWEEPNEPYTRHLNWTVLSQFVLALAITGFVAYLNYHYYRHGEMPPYLQPLKSTP
jgi:hypothetical protein